MPNEPLFDPATLAEIAFPPLVTTSAENWQGHIPFARWLIWKTQPRTYVELGVFQGDSYLAFCDAAVRFHASTKCTGIDSWEGDAHAGKLAETVYQELKAFHDPQFGTFSDLRRGLFEDVVSEFKDGSIDLLHIDGLHTYEAVKGDFETWLPKLSERGVVLFHDTQVRERGFGVWQFWNEVCLEYPSFEFHHNFGLGVLAVGPDAPAPVQELCRLEAGEAEAVRKLFAYLAASIAAHVRLKPAASAPYEIDPAAADPSALHERARTWAREADEASAKIASLENAVASMRASTSWRVTAPLRKLMGLVKK